MGFRVALLGIYHESNTFIDSPTTLADFTNGHWLWGENIRTEYQHAHHEIGGMLEVMDGEGVEILPVMFAEATPGGVIAADAYKTLLDGMLDALEKVLPIDGCLVVPHGAGVSEMERDMDGHWLGRVRELLGAHIPVMGTLDLHANVSQRMVSATDALVAYKRNPHVDQRERGKEAASLLAGCLTGKTNLVQVLVQVPLAISIEQQYTEAEPCISLYALAAGINKRDGIRSVSIAHGFPYADVAEMGTSVIVVADDRPMGENAAHELEHHLLTNRKRFVGEKIAIAQAIYKAEDSEKPVLFLDMGDNIGGGSSGRSLCLVKALEADGRFRYFSYQYDPEAVKQAAAYAVNDHFELCLQGLDQEVVLVNVRLLQKVDGKFREDTPRHGGQVTFDMGETVIARTTNGGVLMLSSLRISPFSLCQLTAFGVDPSGFDIITAKGVNAPIAAYAPACPTIIQVDTPGVTQADMTRFTYKNRRKPLFPFEDAAAI